MSQLPGWYYDDEIQFDCETCQDSVVVACRPNDLVGCPCCGEILQDPQDQFDPH